MQQYRLIFSFFNRTLPARDQRLGFPASLDWQDGSLRVCPAQITERGNHRRPTGFNEETFGGLDAARRNHTRLWPPSSPSRWGYAIAAPYSMSRLTVSGGVS